MLWFDEKSISKVYICWTFQHNLSFFLMLIFVSSKCLLDMHVVAHSNAHLGIEINVFQQNCLCLYFLKLELFLVFSNNSFVFWTGCCYLHNFLNFWKCQIYCTINYQNTQWKIDVLADFKWDIWKHSSKYVFSKINYVVQVYSTTDTNLVNTRDYWSTSNFRR